MERLPRPAALWKAAVLVCLATNGCGSKPKFEFDKLDRVSTHEGLTEFSLGKYKVPIPVVEDENDHRAARRNSFELEFKLFALVPSKELSKLEDAWTRHEGKIRDQVIRVCRSASVDELLEPELASLKARLSSALAPRLGEKDMRQLLIAEVVTLEI